MPTSIATAYISLRADSTKLQGDIRAIGQSGGQAARTMSAPWMGEFDRVAKQAQVAARRISSVFLAISGPMAAGLGKSIQTFMKQSTVEAMAYKREWDATNRVLAHSVARIGEMVSKSQIFGRTISEWKTAMAGFLDNLSPEKVQKLVTFASTLLAAGVALKAAATAIAGVRGVMSMGRLSGAIAGGEIGGSVISGLFSGMIGSRAISRAYSKQIKEINYVTKAIQAKIGPDAAYVPNFFASGPAKIAGVSAAASIAPLAASFGSLTSAAAAVTAAFLPLALATTAYHVGMVRAMAATPTGQKVTGFAERMASAVAGVVKSAVGAGGWGGTTIFSDPWRFWQSMGKQRFEDPVNFFLHPIKTLQNAQGAAASGGPSYSSAAPMMTSSEAQRSFLKGAGSVRSAETMAGMRLAELNAIDETIASELQKSLSGAPGVTRGEFDKLIEKRKELEVVATDSAMEAIANIDRSIGSELYRMGKGPRWTTDAQMEEMFQKREALESGVRGLGKTVAGSPQDVALSKGVDMVKEYKKAAEDYGPRSESFKFNVAYALRTGSIYGETIKDLSPEAQGTAAVVYAQHVAGQERRADRMEKTALIASGGDEVRRQKDKAFTEDKFKLEQAYDWRVLDIKQSFYRKLEDIDQAKADRDMERSLERVGGGGQIVSAEGVWGAAQSFEHAWQEKLVQTAAEQRADLREMRDLQTSLNRESQDLNKNWDRDIGEIKRLFKQWDSQAVK